MSSVPTNLEPSYYSRNHRAVEQRGFPYFMRPRIVTSFSIDANRRSLPNDRRHLQFVRRCPPAGHPVRLDLGLGYVCVIKKSESELRAEMIDNMLRAIAVDLPKYRNMTECQPNNREPFLRADVITWRGTLRQVMVSPYEQKDGWNMFATRYKGTVYLVPWQSEKQVAQKASDDSPEMMRIRSYGFKFEQYQQTKCRNQQPDTSGPVNENEEFNCVFEGRLERTRLLFGAEMDGVDEDQDIDLDTVDLNTARFVELKVSLRAERPNQVRNLHRFKYRNWWSQCYLAGINRMQIGLRTNDGIVDEIYTTSVNELPRQSKGFWNPSACMQFLDDFLYMVQKELRDVDCPHTVYHFEFDPVEDKRVRLTKLLGPNVHSFLPEWYIDVLQTQKLFWV